MGWILVYHLPCSICGRGIMVARQLPKLKTRVRFPSPAPRIQPAVCRFNYWQCGDGIEPDQEGSEQSDSEVKGAQQNHQEHSRLD